MTVHSTTRLITAMTLAAAGALAAVLLGRAEAAMLAMPWVALLVLGLADRRDQEPRIRLTVDHDRVIAGGPVTVGVEVDGLDGGWVEAVWRPQPAFLRPRPGTVTADGSSDEPGDGSRSEPPFEPAPAVGEVVDGSGRAELRCVRPAPAWGSHDVGRVEVVVHHPYGLTEARGMATRELAVRVHPHPIDLRRLLTPWFVRRLTGAHTSRVAARGIEYADTRKFEPGDSPRDINWRASARSKDLLVSLRHPDRSTHLILLIDSFADSGHDAADVLGDAIEATIALAESHLSVSDRVGLIDYGGVIRWVVPGTGRHQLQRLVDALLATRLYESGADRSVTSIPRQALPPRSFVVALSPMLDSRFVDSLFTLRSAGHDVSAVELPPPFDDPHRPGGPVGPGSGDWGEDEVSTIALELWRAERQMTRDQLIERGVVVIRRSATAPAGPEPWDQILHRLTAARRSVHPGRP